MKFTELPTRCPECNEEFSTLIRPVRKMQKKAISLFMIGIAINLVWMGLMLAVIMSIPPETLEEIRFRGRGAALITIVIVVIAFLPGVLIGGFAFSLSKVVSQRCVNCQWKENFVIENR